MVAFPVTADYFIIDTLVGMTENTETKLHVYPNPSKGLFRVNSDSSDEKKVRIYDTFGKLIFEASVFQNQDIDLTPYQDGVYLLRIEQKDFQTAEVFRLAFLDLNSALINPSSRLV